MASTGSLLPRSYQAEAMALAATQNIVVRMDTGMGKTLIAVMLIRHMTSLPTVHVECEEWMEGEAGPSTEMLKKRKRQKLVFFVVPNVPLVSQQANVLRSETSLRIKTFIGSDGVDLWNYRKWQSELDAADVVVLTAQILVNLLDHAYWSMEAISLIVFDECHHAAKAHPYNKIMRHYHDFKPSNTTLLPPKIFGMTASPIFNPKNPQKAIAELEANLAAKIYEVSSPDLDSFAPKAKERLVVYESCSVEELDEDTRCQRLVPHVHMVLTNKSEEQLQAVKEQLGPAAADLFIHQHLLNLLSSTAPSTEQHRLSTLLKEVEPLLPNPIPPSSLSRKLRTLLEDVLLPYADETVFSAIIFVQKRHHALLVAEVLSRLEALTGWIRAAPLVGHGGVHGAASSKDRLSEKRIKDSCMAVREQEATVARFRSGEVNLLVATQVAEEGLDFRACNLVVRLDEITTITGYIQSRGRARSPESSFVVLAEANSVAAARYVAYLRYEPELKAQYANQFDEDIDEPNLPDLPTFRVSSTGAVLTHDEAVSILAMTCALLPRDEYSEEGNRPVYSIEGALTTWRAKVKLPMFACLHQAATSQGQGRRTFTGLTLPSKKAATQSAAYTACLALYEAGGLNEHLLPTRKTRVAAEGANDADGRSVGDATPAFVEVERENVFGVISEEEGADLWLSKVVLLEEGAETLEIALVTGRQMPHFDGARIHNGSPPPAERIHVVQIAESTRIRISVDDRLALIEMNRAAVTLYLNRRFNPAIPLFTLWAPLRKSSSSAVLSVKSIDWEIVRTPFPRASAPTVRPGDALVVPTRQVKQQFLTFIETRRDVTSLSASMDVELAPPLGHGKYKAKMLVALPDYKEFVAKFYDFPDLLNDDGRVRPILSVTEAQRPSSASRLSSISSSLVAAAPQPDVALSPSNDSQKDRLRVHHYPEGFLRHNTLPTTFQYFFPLMPAVYRIVLDRCIASSAISRFNFPSTLHLETLVCALTAPCCNAGYSYQLLETLGDSLLKILTTIHVYLSHPKEDEGGLGILRQNSIDNRFLRRRSLESGFGSFVITDVLRIQGWIPSEAEQGVVLVDGGRAIRKTVSRRPMSDMIESTLAAAWLSSGWETALDVGTKLGLCFGSTTPWKERESAKALVAEPEGSVAAYREVEQRLGYQFRNPELLRRAFTHRSYANALHCYEREEHLGDAILDAWSMVRLFNLFPNSIPSRLTFLRAMLVSNVTLAYLAVRLLRVETHLLHSSSDLDKAIKSARATLDNYSWAKILEDLTWTWEAPKVLGDVFEAVLGAILVDSGFDLDVVFGVLDSIYASVMPLLRDITTRDPISLLLMYVQSRHCRRVKIKTTLVNTISKTYEAVATFHSDTIVTSVLSGSKAVARQLAAREAHRLLASHEYDSTWLLCDCTSTGSLAGAQTPPAVAAQYEVAPLDEHSEDDLEGEAELPGSIACGLKRSGERLSEVGLPEKIQAGPNR